MVRPEIICYRDDWMLRDVYGDTYRLRRTDQPGDPLRIEPVERHNPMNGPAVEPFVVDASGRLIAPAQHEPSARPAGPWNNNRNTTGE